MFSKIQLKNIFPGFEKKWYEEAYNYGILESYPENELILNPGEKIDNAMLVIKGLLKVYRSTQEGSEYFMYFLEPGQACALSLRCCEENKKHHVMVRTVFDSLVMLVPSQKVQEWMETFENWNSFVSATYFSRFNELLNTIDNIAFQQMDERLLSYLEKLASLTGNEIKLTHSEIANDLNFSREVVSRLLKKLEIKGKVVMHRSAIHWVQ